MTPEQRTHLSPDWLARLDHAETADVWTLGFALLHRDLDVIVGGCGFKGSPDADGVVEISYGIDREHEGQGYATEAAEAMVAYAFSDDRVKTVRAHTLASTNASARVLTKSGFRGLGPVVDPEDGQVWRWERARLGAGRPSLHSNNRLDQP